MRFFKLVAGIVVMASLFPSCCIAEDDPKNNIFTIAVAAPTLPKDVQLRYFLASERAGGFSASTASGTEGKIVISLVDQAKSAASFKAIAFVPGCEIVTFSVDDLSTSNRQGEFQCQPLPTTLFQGRIPASAVQGKDLQVEVLYVCNWAPQFLGMGQGAISPLFVARMQVATDGSFSVELPDFSSDPQWSSLSKDASLSFLLLDSKTGFLLNTLQPPAGLSQGGFLPVATNYPGETSFTIQPGPSRQ